MTSPTRHRWLSERGPQLQHLRSLRPVGGVGAQAPSQVLGPRAAEPSAQLYIVRSPPDASQAGPGLRTADAGAPGGSEPLSPAQIPAPLLQVTRFISSGLSPGGRVRM